MKLNGLGSPEAVAVLFQGKDGCADGCIAWMFGRDSDRGAVFGDFGNFRLFHFQTLLLNNHQ